jgi:hypothetical protein
MDRAATRPSAGKPGRGKAQRNVEPRHTASSALNAEERQELGMVAKQAWEACGAKAAGIPADEWRHEQVAIATQGKAARVSDLRRGMFRDVLAHFLLIKGDTARAFRTAQRSGQDMADRDLALHKLREACEEGGLAYPDYPAAICDRQFKCTLDELETGRIWFLFYTCTRRARAKNKNASEIDSETGGRNPRWSPSKTAPSPGTPSAVRAETHSDSFTHPKYHHPLDTMPAPAQTDSYQSDMFAGGDFEEEIDGAEIPEAVELIGEGVQCKMVQYAPGQWAAVLGSQPVPRYGIVKFQQVGKDWRPQFVGWGKKIALRKFFIPDATGKEVHPVMHSIGLDLSYNSVLRLYKNGFITGSMPVPHRILIDIESLNRHLQEASDPDFWTEERVKRFKETIY